MKKGKAAGIDQIYPNMIIHLGQHSIDWLAAAPMNILDKGAYPKIWKHARVVAIPKEYCTPVWTRSLHTKLVDFDENNRWLSQSNADPVDSYHKVRLIILDQAFALKMFENPHLVKRLTIKTCLS
ncbi:hypothetical protein ElyMa_004250700 [Elysia marginata]|uniref:Uncharacterized protein n=1 Tax=Elysia marginata TaxID=1093978 RepID=A0AAV4GSU5_9GAST|nr:hypothetical protein ElyMa_004250700 [Elysia marginata]